MSRRSLAFATDLALLEQQGAAVQRTPTATVVRMTGNPGFRWGNFLLVPSADAGPGALAAAHRAAFPDADFVSVGIDDADADVDPRWAEAGFGLERLAVLCADEPPTAAPLRAGLVRALASDDDWAAVRRIGAEESAEVPDDLFESGRIRERRRLVAGGRALWLGVELDGAVVATLGIADAGSGTARYQDVQTLRAFRRRGFAAALLAAAAQEAAARFHSTRFVIVTEHDGGAIGLYRRSGFADVETQVQLERLGRED